MKQLICIMFAASLISFDALADDVKQFPASFTDTAPTIDGDISDAVWAVAPLIGDFHEVEPIEFDSPSESVQVRVLYDENFLFVAANVTMNDPSQISALMLAQGMSGFGDDWFAVILDPHDKKRSGYRFQLNPNGVRREALFDGPRRPNSNWTGIWNGKARLTDTGWVSEFAIPFKTLNFNPNNSDWGISFELQIFGRAEKIAWTSRNRQTRPGTLGKISGVTRAQQGRGLDVKVSASAVGSEDHELGTSDTGLEPSVDVFYKITPALTAALTLNTDFSATEVDDRVVNLDRFSVFFPEKRGFFLQDADIFSFGGLNRNGIPFFSRRIGLDENREPIDIVAGGKITGREGPFNFGVLSVLQDSLLDDVTLLVGRGSMNVLDESTLGLLVTDGSPVDGESNTVLGVDFNYLDRGALGGRSLRGNAWYQRSDTNGVGGDEDAWGANLEIPRTSGFYGGVGAKQIGADFYPALGFVNRRAIREYEVSFGHRRYPREGYWQFWNHGVEFKHVEGLDGNVESQETRLELFQNGNRTQDWFGLSVFRQREVLNDAFEISDGVIVLPGDYTWNRYQAFVSSGEQRSVYSTTLVTIGDFYDGKRLQVNGNLVWQPSMYFSVNLGFDYNNVELSGGTFVSRLYSLRSTVAFNSEWSWITLAQWDNGSNEAGINTRVRWVPQPGREMIFVINHGHRTSTDDPLERPTGATRSDVVLKASYTFRF